MIFIPHLGVVSEATARVDSELNRYDERLYLRKNLDTGDWCVYVKSPYWADTDDLPVLGLGPVPPIDWYAVLSKIIQMDTQRHASKMLEQVNANNAKKKAEAKYKADEGAMYAAEHLEYARRREGKSNIIKSVRFRGRW